MWIGGKSTPRARGTSIDVSGYRLTFGCPLTNELSGDVLLRPRSEWRLEIVGVSLFWAVKSNRANNTDVRHGLVSFLIRDREPVNEGVVWNLLHLFCHFGKIEKINEDLFLFEKINLIKTTYI